MANLPSSEAQAFLTHWLDTPVNGYLGSGYGSNLKDMLHQPQKTGMGDAVLNKIRVDLPLFGALPRERLNMYAVDQGPDTRRLYIEISGEMIEVGNK